jgi:transcriptional regulator with XRE-family HTH domain
MTQNDLAVLAQVSRRWLSDLEAGKPTAEIGLVFKLLHALGLTLEASPAQPGPDDIDLNDILRAQRRVDIGESDRG